MFTIDQDNRIAYYPSRADCPEGVTHFVAREELDAVAASREWSKQDVTNIYNRFAEEYADLKQQLRFRNRGYGLAKLWDALKRLVPNEVASAAAALAKPTTRECSDCQGTGNLCDECSGTIDECECEDGPSLSQCGTCGGTGRIAALDDAPTEVAKPARAKKEKKTKRTAKAKTEAKAKPKGKTKRDEVIQLISRANGASLDELAEKTDWQRHTLRGLLSTLASKHGLKIESTKHQTKGRVYRLVT
jgi:predicted transcriptional regulator